MRNKSVEVIHFSHFAFLFCPFRSRHMGTYKVFPPSIYKGEHLMLVPISYPFEPSCHFVK